MNIKDQFIPLIGFLVILTAGIVWTIIREMLSLSETLTIASVSILLYTILVWILTWFQIKPRELFAEQRDDYEKLSKKMNDDYERQYKKINATVDKLIQKQRFIDQGILNVIEGEASTIWVITTKLANELGDKNLMEAVEKNLADGKFYTYFLPHPSDKQFGAVEKNLKEFKRRPVYQKYKGQIEFIRLPQDSQFLLDEVVIYNPEKPENSHDTTKGINGFTYYEWGDDDQENEGPLHMKIEGHLLSFLSESLYRILDNTGLKSAVERVLTEFADDIDDTERLYLVTLLSCRVIKNKNDFRKFIERMSLKNKNQAKFIDQILSKYLEP